MPRYQELVKEEEKLASDIRIAEQKCKELNAKQGQRDQFKYAVVFRECLQMRIS